MFVSSRLERLARETYSSIIRKIINYGQKTFYKIAPSKLITVVPINIDIPIKKSRITDAFNFMKIQVNFLFFLNPAIHIFVFCHFLIFILTAKVK